MGCRNRGGGQGTMHPPLILADQVTLSNSGGQIMTTTLLLVPPPSEFQTFLQPGEEGKLGQNTKW